MVTRKEFITRLLKYGNDDTKVMFRVESIDRLENIKTSVYCIYSDGDEILIDLTD